MAAVKPAAAVPFSDGVLSDEVTDAADGEAPAPGEITESPELLDALGRGDFDPIGDSTGETSSAVSSSSPARKAFRSGRSDRIAGRL